MGGDGGVGLTVHSLRASGPGLHPVLGGRVYRRRIVDGGEAPRQRDHPPTERDPATRPSAKSSMDSCPFHAGRMPIGRAAGRIHQRHALHELQLGDRGEARQHRTLERGGDLTKRRPARGGKVERAIEISVSMIARIDRRSARGHGRPAWAGRPRERRAARTARAPRCQHRGRRQARSGSPPSQFRRPPASLRPKLRNAVVVHRRHRVCRRQENNAPRAVSGHRFQVLPAAPNVDLVADATIGSTISGPRAMGDSVSTGRKTSDGLQIPDISHNEISCTRPAFGPVACEAHHIVALAGQPGGQPATERPARPGDRDSHCIALFVVVQQDRVDQVVEIHVRDALLGGPTVLTVPVGLVRQR